MSNDKKRDRAFQHRVRERQAKTGESYQAAWRSLTGDEPPPASNLLQRRIPLPFSTGTRVLPGQSAQITGRPQVETFWPDRLLIKNAGRWIIHQLAVEKRTGGQHTLIEPRDQSAQAFAYTAWQPLPAREVLCGDAIVLEVAYQGSNPEGECFEAVLFGWEDHPPVKAASSSKQHARRVVERKTSPDARRAEIVTLPWNITSPSLCADRVIITNAEDWIVHDIRTRGESIFLQYGDVPATMFSEATDVILEPLKEGDLVCILATYVGPEASAKLTVELSGTATPPPGPRALSYFLPMSTSATSVRIRPNQCAQITGRPQLSVAFLPERLVITNAADWIVNDIKIGNTSWFAQGGDIPALAFDSSAVGNHLMLGPVQLAQDFLVITTRAPSCTEAAPFLCGVQGRGVEHVPLKKEGTRTNSTEDRDKSISIDKPRLILPLTPDAANAHRVGPPISRIPPNQKTRLVVRPIHGAFAIKNLFISNAGTLGGSADWVVNEIEIDGHPQQVPKDISGTLFGSRSLARVSFEGLAVIERDHELALTVTYVGKNPEGLPFFASVMGSRPDQNPTKVPIRTPDPLQVSRQATIRVSEPSMTFRIERFIIEDANTEGGAADWIVNDLRIGNRSQFVQSGGIPGDLFATTAIDTFVKFDAWLLGMMIEIDVTYIGLNKEGAAFCGRFEGTVVRDDEDTPPPDLRVLVETLGQGPAAAVIATCDFRPSATSEHVA
jgi:hypothetical protein